MGIILGGSLPESRVIVRLLRDEEVSDNVDEGNTQYATYAGQDGFHPFKSLSGGGQVEGDSGVFRLLVIGSPTIFESLMLLEQSDVFESGPYKRTRGYTDLMVSLVLVSDPKGQ